MTSATLPAPTPTRPPRDGLIRAVTPGGAELYRAEGDEAAMPTLQGHFARFNEWTEIDSLFEGRFLERFAPGAFKKTIAENRDRVKVLFQHGHDPHVGDKPLGPLEDLREDDEGGFYSVPLLDTEYNREHLLPGLEAGLYGASFRFRVVKESLDEEPERSEANPDGITERTVQEAQLYELGPVTFPAYAGASAGIRSLTDEMIFERMASDPARMRELLDFAALSRAAENEQPDESGENTGNEGAEDEPHSGRAEQGTPETGSRKPLYGHQEKEAESWRL